MAHDEDLYSIPLWIDDSDAPFRTLWAKSSPDGSDGESLSEHTSRLLENVRRLYSRAPNLCGLTRQPRFWPRLAMAAAVHDLGKAAPGFQAMLRRGDKFPYRHEVVSLALMSSLIPGADDTDLLSIASAVATHHRDLNWILQSYAEPEFLASILQDDLAAQTSTLFRRAILPRLNRLPFCLPDAWKESLTGERRDLLADLSKRLGALARLRRHLAYTGAWEATAQEARFLRGGLMIADHSASAHLNLRLTAPFDHGELSMRIRHLPTDPDSCFPHQTKCGRAPGSVVLIAPTGSGKTE